MTKQKREIIITATDDMHIHFRKGKMLILVLPYTIAYCDRATVMPNLNPDPILTGPQAKVYESEIIGALPPGSLFKPIMTIQITPETTPDMISEAKKLGIFVAKAYPRYVTTNSSNGIIDYKALYPVFERMEKEDMVLCIHGESPREEVEGMDKEPVFIDEEYYPLVTTFPGMRVSLEHITTGYAVDTVQSLHKTRGKVGSTISVNYLFTIHDDVIGYSRESNGFMHPHLHCKPTAKTRNDRKKLRQAATSGLPCHYKGNDSAPHPKGMKEAADVCAGAFNAIMEMGGLAHVFDEEGKMDRLENFTSKFGADFYGLPYNTRKIRLVEESWIIPAEITDGEIVVVPFMAGREMKWKVEQVQ